MARHSFGALALLAWGVLAWLSQPDQPLKLWSYFAVMSTAWLATGIGWRAAPHMSIRSILIWATLFRIAALFAMPVFEDDWYRYLWDGRQFGLTGSPYGVAPITSFGDASISATFGAILDGINNPDLPTLYGPVSQLAFLGAWWVDPGALWPLRLEVLLAEGLLLWACAPRLDKRGLLLLSWCPLMVQEVAFNVHPEIFGLALAMAGLRFSLSGRVWLGSGLLALATGARLVALPLCALVFRFRMRTWMIFTTTMLVLYLPFLFVDGESGGLSHFVSGWQFNGSIHPILSSLTGDAAARLIGAAIAGSVLLLLVSQSTHSTGDWPRADIAYGVLFLCMPVLNPWYGIWLVPFVANRPRPWSVVALCAVSLSYVHGLFLPGWDLSPYQHPGWLRPVEYGAVALAGLMGWRPWRLAARTRTRSQSKFGSSPQHFRADGS